MHVNRLRRPGNHAPPRERGQIVVLFALLLPIFLGLGAIVIAVGSWYTHAKHLQTKADAGAFAGGGVWSFPCTTGSDSKIETAARTYVGPHMKADNTPYTGTTYNPQVGGVTGSQIHVVFNGSDWYDDDSNPTPIEKNDPANPSICDSKVLDVKITEDNSFPLFSLLPFFPDIKRKARVEIQEIKGLTGLLPVAVRVPKPLSAAAIFYNEENGNILGVRYLREGNVPFLPPGLSGWTTAWDATNPWLPVSIGVKTGIAIALSFRPECGVGPAPCLDDKPAGVTTVDQFCRQASGTVQCFYATGEGTSQTVQSGIQFIRGYATGTVTDGPPELRSVFLDSPSAGCGAYFSANGSVCTAVLHASIDFGEALDQKKHPGAQADVKYGLVYGTTGPNGDTCLDGQDRPNCDMSGSSSASATVTFDPRFDNQGDPTAVRHAIAIRVRLKNTTIGPPGPGQIDCGNNFSATCQWFFTANGRQTSWPSQTSAVRQLVFSNPVQRSFTGDDNVTASIKFLRLTAQPGCSGGPLIDADAASQPIGQHCFYVEMGLRGAIAQDQDEPAFAFNFKGSQSGAIDCDPDWPNWKTEVVKGCQPFYKANDFTRQPPSGPCPWPEGTQVSWIQFQSPPAPYDAEWPPYTCVRTDGPPAPGQVAQGLKERLFGNPNQATCPADDANAFVAGRNYWDDDNNQSGGKFAFADLGVHPNNLQSGKDPRLVTLFMTAYRTFSSQGGAIYAIVGFGSFYITGFGQVTGNSFQNDDPCPGSAPPPDLLQNSGLSGAQIIWGHFVDNVVPAPFTTGGSGILCRPQVSFQPCVATLVE